MDPSRMSTRFEVNGDIVRKSNVFLLQVLCLPRAPAVRNLGGTCPRQLYGAGAYGFVQALMSVTLTSGGSTGGEGGDHPP